MTICLGKSKKTQWAIWKIANGFPTVTFKSPLAFAKVTESCLTVKVLFIHNSKHSFLEKATFKSYQMHFLSFFGFKKSDSASKSLNKRTL